MLNKNRRKLAIFLFLLAAIIVLASVVAAIYFYFYPMSAVTAITILNAALGAVPATLITAFVLGIVWKLSSIFRASVFQLGESAFAPKRYLDKCEEGDVAYFRNFYSDPAISSLRDTEVKNELNQTGLQIAILNGKLDVASIIINNTKVKYLYNTDKKGKNALMYAVERGYSSLVEVIVRKIYNADQQNLEKELNKLDNEGYTALHLASLNYPMLAKPLLGGGVDRNKKSEGENKLTAKELHLKLYLENHPSKCKFCKWHETIPPKPNKNSLVFK